MKTKYYFSILTSVLLLCSCSEKTLEPITGSLGKPGVVTDVNVEPIAGGAVVSYRIPNSEDILAVKAVYTLTNGKETERVASFYENKIKIEGYNDTIPNKANIYVINRAQELSDPVEVTLLHWSLL